MEKILFDGIDNRTIHIISCKALSTLQYTHLMPGNVNYLTLCQSNKYYSRHATHLSTTVHMLLSSSISSWHQTCLKLKKAPEDDIQHRRHRLMINIGMGWSNNA